MNNPENPKKEGGSGVSYNALADKLALLKPQISTSPEKSPAEIVPPPVSQREQPALTQESHVSVATASRAKSGGISMDSPKIGAFTSKDLFKERNLAKKEGRDDLKVWTHSKLEEEHVANIKRRIATLKEKEKPTQDERNEKKALYLELDAIKEASQRRRKSKEKTSEQTLSLRSLLSRVSLDEKDAEKNGREFIKERTELIAANDKRGKDIDDLSRALEGIEAKPGTKTEEALKRLLFLRAEKEKLENTLVGYKPDEDLSRGEVLLEKIFEAVGLNEKKHEALEKAREKTYTAEDDAVRRIATNNESRAEAEALAAETAEKEAKAKALEFVKAHATTPAEAGEVHMGTGAEDEAAAKKRKERKSTDEIMIDRQANKPAGNFGYSTPANRKMQREMDRNVVENEHGPAAPAQIKPEAPVQNLNTKSPEKAPSTPTPEKTSRLTEDAQALLKKIALGGGIPKVITHSLRRIGEDNGLNVSRHETPNSLIRRLQEIDKMEAAPPQTQKVDKEEEPAAPETKKTKMNMEQPNLGPTPAPEATPIKTGALFEHVDSQIQKVNIRIAELDGKTDAASLEESAELKKEAASLAKRRSDIESGENFVRSEERMKAVTARQEELSGKTDTASLEEMAELKKEAASLEAALKEGGDEVARTAYTEAKSHEEQVAAQAATALANELSKAEIKPGHNNAEAARIENEARAGEATLSPEEKEKVSAGLAGLGFKTNAIKNDVLARGFNLVSSMAGKDNWLGRRLQALSLISEKDAKVSRDSLKELIEKKEQGKGTAWKEVAGAGALIGNITTTGRLLFDIFGGGIGTRIATRGALAAAMAFAAGVEMEKENSFMKKREGEYRKIKKDEFTPEQQAAYDEAMKVPDGEKMTVEELEEKARQAAMAFHPDVIKAHEEAIRIMDEAKNRTDAKDKNGNLKTEALEKAFQENVPKDILARLAQNEGSAVGLMERHYRDYIKKEAEKLQNQIEQIDKAELTPEQKESQKNSIVNGFFKTPAFKDFNKAIDQAGTVDTTFMFLRRAQQVANIPKYAMIAETLYQTLWNGLPKLGSTIGSELYDHNNPVDLEAKAASDAKIKKIVELHNEQKFETMGLANIAALEAREKILNLATINRGEGVESAFIRQLMDKPTDFGFKGNITDTTAVKAWAGAEAHRIAIKTGYVDIATGSETRVGRAGIGSVAYVLEKDASGNLQIEEKTKGTDGKFHIKEAGNKNLNEYEYKQSPASVVGKTPAVAPSASAELEGVPSESLKTPIEGAPSAAVAVKPGDAPKNILGAKAEVPNAVVSKENIPSAVPLAAETPSPKVEVKNITTETEKGAGYIKESTGVTSKNSNLTGAEFLSSNYTSNLKPSAAGFSFDKQMAMTQSRVISSQLEAYRELLSAGKTEEAAKHLEALRTSVDMADKSLGAGVVDRSKIPELGLAPNEITHEVFQDMLSPKDYVSAREAVTSTNPQSIASADTHIQNVVKKMFGGWFSSGTDTYNKFADKTVEEVMSVKITEEPNGDAGKMQSILLWAREQTHVKPAYGEKISDYLRRATSTAIDNYQKIK